MRDESRGRALVYCHAGCETPDVLEALGLHAADLFDDSKGVQYRYSDGRVVHRRPDKSFYQSAADEARRSGHNDRAAGCDNWSGRASVGTMPGFCFRPGKF